MKYTPPYSNSVSWDPAAPVLPEQKSREVGSVPRTRCPNVQLVPPGLAAEPVLLTATFVKIATKPTVLAREAGPVPRDQEADV